jgi:hypothetical protein
VWLQFVSFNDIKDNWDFVNQTDVPASEDGKTVKKFFIYSIGYDNMVLSTFDEFNTGVLSHSSISNITVNGGKKFTNDMIH